MELERYRDGEPFEANQYHPELWPRDAYKGMADALPEPPLGLVLHEGDRLPDYRTPTDGTFPIPGWRPPLSGPRHADYAIFWFSAGLIALALWVWAGLRRVPDPQASRRTGTTGTPPTP